MPGIRATLIDREGTWDSRFFCGPIARLLASPGLRLLSDLGGRVIEGRRGSANGKEIHGSDGPLATYRGSSIGDLELRLSPELCVSPARSDSHCVRPGDVVVTKGSPIRAAIVSNALFRHPVDANCYLIRGLTEAQGLWVALVLNQGAFAEYLIRKSGAAIVPRIRMSVLRDMPIPEPPSELAGLSRRVMEVLDRRIDSCGELTRMIGTVRNEVEASVPVSASGDSQMNSRNGTWWRFFSSLVIEDSWVPGHVAIAGYQRLLRQDGGWVPLDILTTRWASSSERVGPSGRTGRSLQLSDVGDDLTVSGARQRDQSDRNRRIYAEPVGENEVLLSSLVTNPLVAFVGTRPRTPVFPTDHWQRLRFRETPGAWALVLKTPAISQQLQRLAIGAVQQFAQAGTIRKLVLPDIPLPLRIKWDAFLRQWQQKRSELDSDWIALLRQCYRLLRSTHALYGAWTTPPAPLQGQEN